MVNIDDISAELPMPRDDEPASLRTDIVAELADHLECALQRKQHYVHEQRATQHVLARFGDPAAIARRLWWDAMQEKIMSQRMTTAAAIVAALACLGMFVLMWQSLAANRAMLLQTQELVLSLSAGQAENNPPSEWNRLQIQCLSESEDGPPMEGVAVSLDGATEYTFDFPPTTLITDARGLVDFGQVHYGLYVVRLTAPNGMQTVEKVSVRPGQDSLESYICPAGDGLAEVRIEPDLDGAVAPDELSGRIWYRFVLRRYHFDISRWNWPDFPTGDWSRPLYNEYQPETHNWFAAPDGRLISIDEPVPETTLPTGSLAGVTETIWKLPEDAGLQEVLRVEPGWYEVGFAAICVADENDPTGRTLLQMLNPGGEEPSYRGPRHPGTELPKVVYGQNNELSIPVPTKTLDVLERVLENAPAMEVAILPIRSSVHGPLDLGSRAAIYLRQPERLFPEAREQPGPLLTGVEVVSHSGGVLRVLLTPEEEALLRFAGPNDLSAHLIDRQTERTGFDTDVKAALEELSGSTSAESPSPGE